LQTMQGLYVQKKAMFQEINLHPCRTNSLVDPSRGWRTIN
jgi:hypothetical protein